MINRNKKIFFDQPVQVTGVDLNTNAVENSRYEPETIDLSTKGFIIPFFRGEYGKDTINTSSGYSTNVIITGFGSASGSITLSNNQTAMPSFLQNAAQRCYTFIMPYTAYLKAIAFTAIPYEDAGPPTAAYHSIPYLALYTASSETTNFTLLQGAKVQATDHYTTGTTSSRATSGYAQISGIQITAGTRVAIVQGLDTTSNGSIADWFEIGGALFFSDIDD